MSIKNALAYALSGAVVLATVIAPASAFAAFGYGGGVSGVPGNFVNFTPPGGLVLGASTSTEPTSTTTVTTGTALCGTPYLTSYLGLGKKNDSVQVRLLQQFLNEYLGLKIPVTGFFGPMTFNAVKQFQLKESASILAPWVAYGLPNANTATGYVYKMTLYRINQIKCAALNAAAPQLP